VKFIFESATAQKTSYTSLRISQIITFFMRRHVLVRLYKI